MKKLLISSVLLGVMITAFVVQADPPGLEEQRAAMTLEDAIMALRPGINEDRSRRLANIFEIAGKQHGFDPKFLVSIAFRESSLVASIEQRRRFGKSRNEIGLMQCHGAALSFRPLECSERLEGAHCQIQTGTRYLAHIRDNLCPGSTWRILAAYGHGACLSEQEARQDRGVKRVMRYYKAIGGRI